MIKLSSKSLIEYFGKDEITDEELEEIDSIYLAEEDSVKEEDVEDFKKDLIQIVKEGKMINEIAINAPSDLIPVEELIKYSPTENIKFRGSEEIFEAMKNNEVSDSLKQALFLDKGATEYDLFESLTSAKALETLPTIDAKDLETVLKYIDVEDVKIQVNNNEEYQQIQKHIEGKDSKLKVDIATLKANDKLWRNNSSQIYLTTNKVKDLSVDELNMLEENYNIEEVYMGDEYDVKENTDIDDSFDVCCASEHYDNETYKRIRRELEKVVDGIDPNASDLDKFIEVYKRLGNKISYDHERMDIDIGDNGAVFLGGLSEIHNLEGGLFEDLAVCEGYAKILHQALDMVGVDSKFVVGDTNRGLHAWNQVKIDDKWYNTDLTWDAYKIKEGRPLDYCLQNDENFLFHTPSTNRDVENCLETISPDMVNEKMGVPEKTEIEDKEYSVDEAMDVIKNINLYNDLGIRAAIRKDLDYDGYTIALCSIKENGGYEWHDNGIKIGELGNVSKFIEEYSKLYYVDDIEHSGVVDFISSKEGVGLILDDNMKEVLNEQGIDCDQLMRASMEREPSNIEDMNQEVNPLESPNEVDIKEEVYEEKISNEIENNIEQQLDNMPEERVEENFSKIVDQDKSLQVYKPSLWRNIVNAFKNRIEKIKERFSSRNKDNSIDKDDELDNELQNELKNSQKSNDTIGKELDSENIEKEETKEVTKEELPSWDLRNWSEQELAEAKEQARIEKERKELEKANQEQDKDQEQDEMDIY